MRQSQFSQEQIVMALRQAKGRNAGVGGVPEAGGERGDVLPVEEAVREPRGV